MGSFHQSHWAYNFDLALLRPKRLSNKFLWQIQYLGLALFSWMSQNCCYNVSHTITKRPSLYDVPPAANRFHEAHPYNMIQLHLCDKAPLRTLNIYGHELVYTHSAEGFNTIIPGGEATIARSHEVHDLQALQDVSPHSHRFSSR